MLFGRSNLLHVNGSRKLVECEENAAQQIAFSVRHPFLDRHAVFARVVLPAAQNFDLLIP
jgi:hypothetical protein